MTHPVSLYIAYDPVYCLPLPEGHRFPMVKYELIPEQLVRQGIIARENLFSPGPCPEEIVLKTHTREYVGKLVHQQLSGKEQRAIGFPQSPELTSREFRITRGTIQCCEWALIHGVSLNVAGGTHHAFADHGEGFCLLNDFAVAANDLLERKLVKKILIIDLDVHQGNGTASIFRNDERVFTFSMHGEHNYPFRKEKSDLDIPLPDGTTDSVYHSILDKTLPELIEKEKPDFAMYVSGVDILATDRFGKLQITPEGCRKRDESVFSILHKREIPCAVSMGGGYAEKVKDIVDAHCATFQAAKEIYCLE